MYTYVQHADEHHANEPKTAKLLLTNPVTRCRRHSIHNPPAPAVRDLQPRDVVRAANCYQTSAGWQERRCLDDCAISTSDQQPRLLVMYAPNRRRPAGELPLHCSAGLAALVVVVMNGRWSPRYGEYFCYAVFATVHVHVRMDELRHGAAIHGLTCMCSASESHP